MNYMVSTYNETLFTTDAALPQKNTLSGNRCSAAAQRFPKKHGPQTSTKSYQSQIPVAFGIPGHVTTKHLPDTPC